MRLLTSVLKTIWGLWGAIAFAVTIILFVPFYFIIFSLNIGGRKTAPHLAHRVTRIASAFLFTLLLIRVRTRNRKLLNRKQVYIFVSNHRSLLDIPACALSTQHTFRYLSKVELTKIPLFGYIIRKLYITVSRKDKEDRARSIEAMTKSLNDGISVYIYPEGTRNKTPEPLKSFYDGAFRLALHSGLPIAVMTIRNSEKLLHNYQLRPGTMECIWSEPVQIEKSDTIDSLKEKVRVLMWNQLTADET